MKKVIALLLALVMTFSVATVAFATEGETTDAPAIEIPEDIEEFTKLVISRPSDGDSTSPWRQGFQRLCLSIPSVAESCSTRDSVSGIIPTL